MCSNKIIFCFIGNSAGKLWFADPGLRNQKRFKNARFKSQVFLSLAHDKASSTMGDGDKTSRHLFVVRIQ